MAPTGGLSKQPMKTSNTLLALLIATTLSGLNACAQRGTLNQPPAPARAGQVPPPISVAPAPPVAPAAGPVYVYDQKPLAGRPALVQPDQAQAIIDRFKKAYPQLGSPRLLIYVNRDLVDENSGLKMIARTEKSDTVRTRSSSDFQVDPNFKAGSAASNGASISAGGNVIVNGNVGNARDVYPGKGQSSSSTTTANNENRYRLNERKEPTLADRQTVRDVERLFGRPLRMGGASLADQRLATQLIADKTFQSLSTEGEAARKDRAALARIADAVVEVLISSKNIQVAEVSGDKIYAVPDIQVTAMRLSDSRILGQASSSDLMGKERHASAYARNFDVREIAEATALALMEDMLTGVDVAKP